MFLPPVRSPRAATRRLWCLVLALFTLGFWPATAGLAGNAPPLRTAPLLAGRTTPPMPVSRQAGAVRWVPGNVANAE